MAEDTEWKDRDEAAWKDRTNVKWKGITDLTPPTDKFIMIRVGVATDRCIHVRW